MTTNHRRERMSASTSPRILDRLGSFSRIRADGDSEVLGRGGATSVSDGRDRRLDCLHDLDVDYYPGILSVGK